MRNVNRHLAIAGALGAGAVWILVARRERPSAEPARRSVPDRMERSGDRSAVAGAAGPQHSLDEVTALAALYQGDRGDAASSLNAVLALLGAAIAYITATLALSADIHDRLGWMSVFIPLPVWFIAAFHSLMVVTATLRAASLKAVEKRLLALTAFTSGEAESIGIASYERVMNMGDRRADPFHRLASLLAYGGVFLSAVAYTTYIVVHAVPAADWRVVTLGGYAVLLVFVGCSWARGSSVTSRTESVLRL